MMLSQEFQGLPPKMFMHQIMDTLTKTYVFLWDKKDVDNRVDLNWFDVTKSYNKNSFRTCIRKLNNEGLLSYRESEEGIFIELVGWSDIN